LELLSDLWTLADFRVVILSTATEILLGVDQVVIDG
jgi:hypothetical protein